MKLNSKPEIFFEQLSKRALISVSEINRSGRETCLGIYDRLARDPLGEMRIKIDLNKEKEFLLAIIVSHYLEESIKGLIQYRLSELITKRVPLEDRELFLQLLDSEGYCRVYLLETSRFWKNSNEFFGSLNSFKLKVKFQFYKEEDLKYLYNPINHSRHRGYRDKGSLGSSFIGHKEYIKDFSNREWEERRQEREQVSADTANLIRGFLE